jgi:hypothetical protein
MPVTRIAAVNPLGGEGFFGRGIIDEVAVIHQTLMDSHVAKADRRRRTCNPLSRRLAMSVVFRVDTLPVVQVAILKALWG